MNRAAAALVAFAAVALLIVDVALIEYFGTFVIVPVALSPFALVGALLIARVPRNAVGWLLSGSGVVFGLTFAGGAYGWLALVRDPGHLPGGEVAAAYAQIGFTPGIALAVLMLLFFPSGHGLGGRWTWLERAVVAGVVLITLVDFLKDVPVPVGPGPSPAFVIANPFALHGPLGQFVTSIAQFADASTFPIVFVGPVSLFIRYRRSSAVEREQIKWLAYSGTLAFVLIVLGNAIPGDLGTWLFPLAFVVLGTLPIAIAIAIFRYRLYDIDVLIRRTVIYGATTVGLAVTFFAVILLVEAILSPFTRGNELAVAASTLVSLALFQPLRSRVQNAVDRRFYRSRYDAARTLDDFSVRLRDQVALDAVRADLLDAVRDTVQPAHASVWLRE